MADPSAAVSAAAATSTTGAAAVASAGAAVVFGGVPPPEVIAWAVLGGVVAVWIERKADVVITAHWMINALVLIAVSAISGVALSAAVLALAHAQAFSWIAPLAYIPHWAMAAIIAGAVHKVAPLVLDKLRARAAPRPPGPADPQPPGETPHER